jgi:FkbM family methyltransferase
MTLLFSHIPKIAKELSGGSFLFRIRLVLFLWYFALSRKVLKKEGDFKILGKYAGQTITFYLRYVMDIAVLREVFVDKEYDWCPIENPKVIIDLGAHFGDTALYYHARFPNAKIIAVEPSPENYERLVQHTKNILNIIPVQAAIGSSDGEITLNLMPSSLGHSVVERKDTESSVSVPLISMATLFKKYGINKADLIKFDIEGAEFAMLESVEPKNFSTVYIGELHFDLVEGYTLVMIKNLFDQYELTVEQLSNQDRCIIRAVNK